MTRKLMLLATAVWIFPGAEVRSQDELRLTAITINATDIDGYILIQERWNTIAPHPAWTMWVKDGAIPGNNILNNVEEEGDRTIDIPLSPGEHTFTVGVSHTIGGELCCDAYSLNLFFNGSPIAEFGDEEPSITGWVEPDWNGPDVGVQPPLEEQPWEGGAMGFPLQTFPPAALDFEDGDFQVELTNFVFYPKSAGLDIDVTNTGSQVGEFIPDDEPDAIGQFTIVVTRVGGGLLGDFNQNGVLDLPDIDALTGQSASGTHDLNYDLNTDGQVNVGDVNVWVKDLYNGWIGDANLDKEFNSGDLVAVLSSGTYEADVDAVWSTGDFNGDGRTNSGDLVAALSDGGYEAGPPAQVVPEPSSLVLAAWAVSLIAARMRLRSSS